MSNKGILWAAVTRDGTVLAECGQDMRGGDVKALAMKILGKKPSPGWEFDSKGALKACKFHLHTPGIVWAACCVYANGDTPEREAKGFLEKIILLSEPLRETPQWRSGPTLAAQDTFAPTLLQRMEQANSVGKLALVQRKEQVQTPTC